MTAEDIARYTASVAAIGTGAGLALSVPWAVPPALVWLVLFLLSAGCAVGLWRRHFENVQNDRDRERYRPDRPQHQQTDRPYQPSTPDEPQY